MEGFIVYPTYSIKEGSAYVHLYGRLSDGRSFLTINHYRPYFFIREKDLEKARDASSKLNRSDPSVHGFDTEKTSLVNFDKESVIKIILDIPSDIPKLRKAFEEEDISTYEADIRFAYRFMMDNDLFSSMTIEGEAKDARTQGYEVDIVFEEPRLSRAENINVELKTFSFDIETNGLSTKLFSIAVYTKEIQKVILVGKDLKRDDVINAKDEKEALILFSDMVRDIDPDIITGWNVVDFDLAFLQDKFKEHRVPFRISRNDQEASVRIEDGFMMDSKAKVPGRVVLDGLSLLKNTFFKLDDYKLDTAASSILGEKKTISGENKVREIEDAYRYDPNKLVVYNLKDSELVYKILEKTNLIELTMKRSLLVGMPLDRVQASVASLDSLYLRELRQRGIVADSAKVSRKDKGVTGGFVMSSKPGIYDYVIVCDFKSLYPSVIRTFNIDPLSYVRGQSSEDVIIAPNGARFDKAEGLLPGIIKRLWQSRDEMKKKNDPVASHAIKIHMNSIYGVLANPTCRFYSYDMANAITTFGREIIQSAAELIKENGYDVIYGDTDSIFVNLHVDDPGQASRLGKEIEKTVNDHFNTFIKERYGRKNVLEIQFEKLYTRFMMPYTRGTLEGAKKRYAGLLVKDGEEKIDFTGLEFVRRDWTALSKKFQLELLDRIFHKKEVTEFVREFVKDLRKGKYDDLLTYRKSLRKSTEDYVKTTPPHVKAARLLEEAGKLDTTIIEYIMTKEGPQPKSMVSADIDYEHYIEKQIKPIADSVLVFYGKEFDDLISGSSQVSLFDF